MSPSHPVKNILVPLSLWDTTDIVVAQAKRLAEPFDSTLHLMHAVEVPSVAAKNRWPEELRSQRENEIGKLRKRLQAQADALQEEEIEARAEIVEGEEGPAEAILEQAETLDADMIVMGTHERGLLYKALIGDVATEVLRRASCLVTIVPAHLVKEAHEKQAQSNMEAPKG